MNQQLDEFMMQAERYAQNRCGYCGHSEYPATRNKKFAELIVQECLDAVLSEDHGSTDEWDRGVRAAETAIKERFDLK